MSIIVVLSKLLVVHTITNKLHLLNSAFRNERTDRKFNFLRNRHFEVGKKNQVRTLTFEDFQNGDLHLGNEYYGNKMPG